jgi:hypothetical protein
MTTKNQSLPIEIRQQIASYRRTFFHKNESYFAPIGGLISVRESKPNNLNTRANGIRHIHCVCTGFIDNS